jgi:hypothetical protein
MFIQHETEWLDGQQYQMQLDIYVIGLWIDRLNKFVDILGPRNNNLNNLDIKGFCTSTFSNIYIYSIPWVVLITMC